MKSLVLVVLTLVLVSCSTTPASFIKDALVGGDKPSLSVETELNTGLKQEAVNTDVQLGNKQTASVINNNQKEEVPRWVVLLMILGWVLPSPQEIYREIKRLTSALWDKIGGGDGT